MVAKRSRVAEDKNVHVGVRFSAREGRRIERYCEQRGVTQSEMVRAAVTRALDVARIEDPGPVGADEPEPAKTVGQLLKEALRGQSEA